MLFRALRLVLNPGIIFLFILSAPALAGDLAQTAAAKPALCAGGRFLLPPGAGSLLPGSSLNYDGITIQGSMVGIDSGCQLVSGRIKISGKKTKVTANWKNCGTLGKSQLTATFDASCSALTGTFKTTKNKTVRFTARRSDCGDGLVDTTGGEQCETSADCSIGATCHSCGCGPTYFDPQDSWGSASDPLPPGAVELNHEEFLRRVAEGGVTLITPAEQQKLLNEEAARLAADQTLVQQAIAAAPRLAHLVDWTPPADAQVLADGGIRVQVGPPGQEKPVMLSGPEVSLRELAGSLRRFPQRSNQEALYSSLFELIPEDQRIGFPDPLNLDAVTDEDLKALVLAIEAKANQVIPNVGTPVVNDGGLGQLSADTPPLGCSDLGPANSIWDNADWPLKRYMTGIRSQGGRGTCAAHGIAAGLEAALWRTRGRQTNLSEQELYAKAKGVWHPSSNAYGDGVPTETVLGEMIEKNFPLHTETAWSYNPSWSRVEDDDNETYSMSCSGYGESCSDTNHQMGYFCTTVLGTRFCGYQSPVDRLDAPNESYRLTGVAELWNGFEPENSMERVRAHLRAGHPVVFGFNIDQVFKTAELYAPFVFDLSWDDIGGHAVMATAYFTNEELIPLIYDVPNSWNNGGGYLVIKNSWGCGYGDRGYSYLSHDWVIEHAKTATAILGVSGNYPTLTLITNKSVFPEPGTAAFTAAGNDLVTRVEFFKGLAKIGQDSSPPFKFSYGVTADDNGTPGFFARGFDAANNQVISNVVTLNVNIDVTPPVVTLSATSTTVIAPGSTTLVANATDNRGVVKVDFFEGFTKLGTDTTPPFAWPVSFGLGDLGEHNYLAMAYDAQNNKDLSPLLKVTVLGLVPPVIASFSAAPGSLPVGGGQTTLSWSVAGASSLSIDHGVGDVTGLSEVTVPVTESTVFTLSATNAQGTTTRQTLVYVSVGLPPAILSFQANPPAIEPGGGPIALSWFVRFADSVSIDQGIGDVTTSSSREVTIGAATTFTITASNEYGTVTRQLLVPIDLWASPSGNDLNPGTSASPLKTIARAAALAGTSATIHLMNGVWDESVETRFGGGDAAPCGSMSGVTLPAGVSLVAVNPGQVTLRIKGSHGLCLSGNTLENLLFEHEGSNGGRMIESAAGESSIRATTFSGGHPAITLKGTAKVVIQAFPAVLDSFSGPNSHTFATVAESAELTVRGAPVNGTLTDGVSGNSVFQITGGTLSLEGVRVQNSTQSAAVFAAGGTVFLRPGTELVGPSDPNGQLVGVRLGGTGQVVMEGAAIRGYGFGIYARNYDAVNSSIELNDCEITGNRYGFSFGFANMVSPVRLVRTLISGNTQKGMQHYAEGETFIEDCQILKNGTSITGDGISLPTIGTKSVHVRGTTFAENGGAGLRITGNGLAQVDLGSVTEPGGNHFIQNSAGANVILNGGFLALAVGNEWRPGVQGADGTGHYTVQGAGTKLEVISGKGANYEIQAGSTLRLAENP